MRFFKAEDYQYLLSKTMAALDLQAKSPIEDPSVRASKPSLLKECSSRLKKAFCQGQKSTGPGQGQMDALLARDSQ